ncbi:hypothetical protein Syun_004745 [Stephania yunnanensis]|uniref:Protein kinase domain-containing protein n=1 Tax=Stephania yunnanensis TaxID=152371 RepID=A0AAP0L3N1_9MAGN
MPLARREVQPRRPSGAPSPHKPPLRGTLPPNTLTGLDQLRLLNLRNNSLTGPLPDLSPLYHLRALFLDHNSFSGRFPISVLSFPRLRFLDLSHNAFSGPIPDALADLPDIRYVRLDSNRFTGSVPALNQTSLVVFNVSRNELSGAVPVTRALLRFDGSAFGFNPGLCGRIVGKECGDELGSPFFRPWVAGAPAPATSNGLDQQLQRNAPPPPPIRRRRESRTGLISVFSVLSLVLIGCVVSLLLLGVNRRKQERLKRVPMLHKRAVSVSHFGSKIRVEEEKSNNNNNNNVDEDGNNRKMNNSNDKANEAVKSGNLVFCAGDDQIYTLEQLMRGSAELIGRGTIGSTYKAVLESNVCVTVKRFDGNKTHVTSREMFERHIVSVSRLRHPNLVPLRAYLQARDREERLLIYDYQANGSVFSLVHGSRSTRAKPMHWTSCLKIAEDVAHGLAYIHQTVRLVHGNLKASNVLLGSDFEALLTDYCLTVFARPPLPEHNMDSYAGYKAPEIQKSGNQVTSKSDVYAFGVLLLELLTCKTPSQQPFLMHMDLLNWVRHVRGEEAVDEKWLGLLLDIVVACSQASPEQRPTMWQVLKMIQEIKESAMSEVDSSSVFS